MTAAAATSKATFRGVAYEGRELGLPIIPCGPDKRPLIKWAKYQKRLPTPAEIESWPADAHPALVTGELAGVDALDFDPGHEAWPPHPHELPADVVVKTPRGGAHHYIRHVPGARNSASAVAKGVDIRAQGGYALLPGGPLPYEYAVGSLAEIAALRDGPDVAPWLADALLNGGTAEAPEGGRRDGTGEKIDPTAILAGVPKGQRNDALFKEACRLEGLRLTEAEALPIVEAAAAAAKPPYPSEPAEETPAALVARVFRTYRTEQPNGDDKGAGASPRAGPVVVCMADVTPEKVKWRWKHWIPSEAQTALVAVAGAGKSTVALDLAARVSRGWPWPDGDPGDGDPGDVLILSGEDSTSMTIRPKLDAMDADVARVSILIGVRRRGPDGELSLDLPHLVQDLPAIEAALGQLANPKLMIVDPISCYLTGVDTHKDAAVRGALMPLAALAERMGIAVLTVMHFRKDTTGSALVRICGSGAFGNAARSVIAIAADGPGDERNMGVTKANLTRKPPALSFTLGTPPGADVAVATWAERPLDRTIEDILAADAEPPDRERDAAGRWLAELLADGPVLANAIFAAADAAGHSTGTLRRAKVKIGAEAHKPKGVKDAPWEWSLP